MSSGICHLPCIPLRAAPDSRSELTSQLLMGETYRVLEQGKDWLLIRMDWDNYEGWINRTQFHSCHNEHGSSDAVVNQSLFPYRGIGLSMGSELTLVDGELAPRHDLQYRLTGSLDAHTPTASELAHQFLETPYLWGGRTSMGIDCSGLVQVIYKALGYVLPRDSRDQAFIGDNVSFLQEAQPGDLAYFDNEEGVIVHVGLLISSEEIIHAHGKVRKDKIDGQGIFNSDTQHYSHKLRLIKRLDA